MSGPLFAFPSTDLALISGAKVAFRFFARFIPTGASAAVWTDMAAGNTITHSFPAGVATLAGATLTAGTGSAIGAITIHASTDLSCLVRVRVFDSVATLFTTPATLALETSRADRVLPIFAMMKLGSATTLCDITSHPQLAYHSSDTSVLDVDALGRVTTTAKPGPATITVSLVAGAGAAAPLTISVTVSVPPASRPILKKIRSATAPSPRALLFLSEGFKTEADFTTSVNAVVNHIFTKIEPYALAASGFEVYRAFVASQDNGITVCPPAGQEIAGGAIAPGLSSPLPQAFNSTPAEYGLAELLGEVGPVGATPPASIAAAKTAWGAALATPARLTPNAFAAWLIYAKVIGAYAPRESAFGLCYAARLAGPETVEPPTRAASSLEGTFLQARQPTVTLHFDARRVPDLTSPSNDIATAGTHAFDAFLTSLAVDAAHPGFGARWATGGEDAGLACFVVNDDATGGTRFPGGLAASVGSGFAYKVTPVAGMTGLFAHAPVWSAAAPAPSPAVMADRVAHEFTHAFALLDEYGGTAHPDRAAAVVALADAPNAETQWTVTVGAPPTPLTTATPLDGTKLRWASLPRVEQSAPAVKVTASGATVVIQVLPPRTSPPARPDWSKLAAGRAVQLRVLRRRKLAPSANLSVVSFDATKNELTCSAPAGVSTTDYAAHYSTDAALILYRVDAAGHPMTVIDPAVVTDLAAHGALAGTASCSAAGTPRQSPRAGITGVTYPLLDYRLIGAYVGGATYNCEVLRPCGACKMRSVLDPALPALPIDNLCFICMYAFVEDTAIAELGALDASWYPS